MPDWLRPIYLGEDQLAVEVIFVQSAQLNCEVLGLVDHFAVDYLFEVREELDLDLLQEAVFDVLLELFARNV